VYPKIIKELTAKAKSDELRCFNLSSFMSDRSLEEVFEEIDKDMKFFSVYIFMEWLEDDFWLSVISPFLKEPQPLIDRLLEDIKSPDPELRLHAAFALGWGGNLQAAIPLIELLYDLDIRVQQTAVNALSNLRDDRILSLMLERLEHGPLEQKRCILLNLWRFYSKREEVISIYLRYLDHENADLRFDALVLLATMTEAGEHIATYRKCLKDKDPRIRALALKELNEVSRKDVLGLKEEIEGMLSDPDMEVKKAAMKILKKL
jgi:HEAT repeat protein